MRPRDIPVWWGTFGTVRPRASGGCCAWEGFALREVAVFLVLLATVSPACTQEEPVRSPTPTTPTVVAAPLPEGWARCVNEARGWSIGYPETWFTTDAYTDRITGETVRRPAIACMFFDPNRFTIPLDGEYPETALQVGIGRSPIETALGYLTDPKFYRTLVREGWIVLGRPAVRLEVESLGRGLVLKGTLRYGWIVDLGEGRSFSVLAQAIPGTSSDLYLAYREVAERAIATIELPPT